MDFDFNLGSGMDRDRLRNQFVRDHVESRIKSLYLPGVRFLSFIGQKLFGIAQFNRNITASLHHRFR